MSGNKRPADDVSFVAEEGPVLFSEPNFNGDIVLKRLYQITKTHCDNRSIPMARIFLGGWEVWLQVQLAIDLVINSNGLFVAIPDVHGMGDNNGWAVRRELQVWDKSNKGADEGKCDIWLDPIGEDNLAYCFELKVEYSTPTEDIRQRARKANDAKKGDILNVDHDVAGRFIDDIKKSLGAFNEETRKTAPKHGIKLVCMAVTTSPADTANDSKKWKDVQELTKNGVNYTWIEAPTGSASGGTTRGVALLWWTKTVVLDEGPSKVPKTSIV